MTKINDGGPELKPCPFCGKIPKRVYLCGHQKIGTGPWSELWVTDHTCAPGHGDSPSSAAKNWNRRADLVPAPGWQPIETAPHETLVILGWRENGVWKQEIALASAGERLPNGYSNRWWHGQATHWMPLPAPPSEGVEP